MASDEERAIAYRKLRAAAHRLLCETRDVAVQIDGHSAKGVLVRSGKLAALSRALDEADLLEPPKEEKDHG